VPTPANLSPLGTWHQTAQILTEYKHQRDVERKGLLDNFRHAEEYALSLEKIVANHQQEATIIQEIVEARDAEITSLRHLVAARETENTALNEALASTRSIVQAYEAELTALRTLATEYAQTIATLQDAFTLKESELNALKNSRLYRLNKRLNNWLP
jgi:chromosome segregation ATPase